MINVTKSYLPPLKEYAKYLEKIWETNWVTNNGPFVVELENKLKEYLGIKNLFFLSNGTIGLQIAIKVLGITGEIITTPFSYVASTSSIVWENCKPVFVDIDPLTLCIDASKIESAITEKTEGILAVHVYGNPCKVEKIEKIAKKYKLKVIYDAAHAFGVKFKGSSVLKYGDISILSFHATKIFHTVEGGAIVTNDKKLAHKISWTRDFGHKGQENFWGLGINGKNSELHAAMGLSILPEVDFLIKKRKKASGIYDRLLKNLPLKKPNFNPNASLNYGYYPVIFESEQKLLKTRKLLNNNNIFPRRYFYPPLNKLPYLKVSHCEVAEDISRRILCLPLYHCLSEKELNKISKIIKEA